MNDCRARSRLAVGPGPRPRPFVGDGAVEALELAVPAWRGGRCGDVACLELVEQGAEDEAGVGLVVVGHDGLDRAAALLAHPGGGASQRRADSLACLA